MFNESGNVVTDDLEDLKRRLVVGHKSDGRSVYDEAAKSELVALCRQPGASVSRLARECGVNANQVSRWLREHGFGGRTRKAAAVVPAPAFVAVAVQPASPVKTDSFGRGHGRRDGRAGALAQRGGDRSSRR